MTKNTELDRTKRTKDGSVAAPTPAKGTIHDPNSVTTDTPQEPDHGVYPPKGEKED